jgi:hypothetical protein
MNLIAWTVDELVGDNMVIVALPDGFKLLILNPRQQGIARTGDAWGSSRAS